MTLKEAYDTLQLASNATLLEAQHRYRFLAMAFHPDRFPKDSPLRSEAEENFKRIGLAWETTAAHLKAQDEKQERARMAAEEQRERHQAADDEARKYRQERQRTTREHSQDAQGSSSKEQPKASHSETSGTIFKGRRRVSVLVATLGLCFLLVGGWIFYASHSIPVPVEHNPSLTNRALTASPVLSEPTPPTRILPDSSYVCDLGYQGAWKSLRVSGKTLTERLTKDDDLLLVVTDDRGFEKSVHVPDYVLVGEERIWRAGGESYFIQSGNYPHFSAEFGCFVYNIDRGQESRVRGVDGRYLDSIFINDQLHAKSNTQFVQILGARLPDALKQRVFALLGLNNFQLVNGELCSELYCDGLEGPHYRSKQSAPMDSSLFRKYKLWVGMKYSKARKILESEGWMPIVDSMNLGPEEMPEAVVGNATGSAELFKGHARLFFTLTPDYEVDNIEEAN